MKDTAPDSSCGVPTSAQAVADTSHAPGHKRFYAEVKDLEQAADVISARLEPKPPNFLQKILRAAAIPLGIVGGYTWGRTHAWEGFLKFLENKKTFDDPMLHIPNADEIIPKKAGMSDSEKMGTWLLEHEKIKTDRAKNILKLAPGREKAAWQVEWNALESELQAAKESTLNAIKAEKMLPLLEKLKLVGQREVNLLKFTAKDHTRAAGLVFQSLFAGGAALGMALTVSDNKNFMNFFGKKDTKSNPGSEGKKPLTWEARHDAESASATAGLGNSIS